MPDDVQRRLACGNHSGPSRKPFRDRAKTVRLPSGITVRLQPGIVFVFTPERFSRSPRNPFRLAPESTTDRQLHSPVNAPPISFLRVDTPFSSPPRELKPSNSSEINKAAMLCPRRYRFLRLNQLCLSKTLCRVKWLRTRACESLDSPSVLLPTKGYGIQRGYQWRLVVSRARKRP